MNNAANPSTIQGEDKTRFYGMVKMIKCYANFNKPIPLDFGGGFYKNPPLQ